MQRSTVSVIAAAALLASAGTTLAATPAGVKAAHDATRQAKAVTYRLEAGMGTVTLQRIGTTRSRITVQLTNPAAAGTRVTLHSGRQCHEAHAMAPATSLALNPVSQQVSQTIVALPLEKLQSGNYLVDVQNATARSQFATTCARLGPP
ncbi:MAG TPA: hypothetical protein VHT05_12935 [Candidatus Elarobacter sp.]|nr:hypothetical protein [Candidatus Elarobacter sp.]